MRSSSVGVCKRLLGKGGLEIPLTVLGSVMTRDQMIPTGCRLPTCLSPLEVSTLLLLVSPVKDPGGSGLS